MAGLIGSIFNGLGNLVSGGTWKQSGQELKQQEFNASEAEKQRNFEAEQARINREYQERMSNTAVQRQVADAKAAGINPAMMYANSSASGASTPSGSSASGTAARSSYGNSSDSFSSTLNSASNLARTFNYDKNRKNDVNLKQVLNTVAAAARLFK